MRDIKSTARGRTHARVHAVAAAVQRALHNKRTLGGPQPFAEHAAEHVAEHATVPVAPEHPDVDVWGYVVLRGAVQVGTAVRHAVVAALEEQRPIFNHNSTTARDDRCRLQATVPLTHDDLPGLAAALAGVPLAGGAATAAALRPSPWVAITSLPGCQAQAAHTDWEPTTMPPPTTRRTTTSPHGASPPPALPALGVLVALEHDTHLDVWPRSHVLFHTTTHREEGTAAAAPAAAIRRHQVHLAPGDVVLFRGDCVHAGAAYARANTRLHQYLDTPRGHKRPHNRTWLVADDFPALASYIADA